MRLTPAQLQENARYGYLPGGPEALCNTVPNRRIMIGRAFFTNTFAIAPRISLLDGDAYLAADLLGEFGVGVRKAK